MKRIITWLYKRFVGELFVPPHTAFSVGLKSDAIPEAKYWMSYLPEVMTLYIKTAESWQYFTFKK